MTQGNLFIKSTNKTWFSLLSHLFKVVILPSKRRWNTKPPVHICCCCCCLSCGVHDEVEDDPDCEGQCHPHTVTWLSSASVSISRMSLSLSLISSSVSSSLLRCFFFKGSKPTGFHILNDKTLYFQMQTLLGLLKFKIIKNPQASNFLLFFLVILLRFNWTFEIILTDPLTSWLLLENSFTTHWHHHHHNNNSGMETEMWPIRAQ